jgi:uncharacterized membrane protein
MKERSYGICSVSKARQPSATKQMDKGRFRSRRCSGQSQVGKEGEAWRGVV